MSTASNWIPECAMVLAAGLGTRMRPLTGAIPKPLVVLDGRALLDHVLDRIAAAGIPRAVVNVHYLAATIESHLASRTRPRITISDERDRLLETGGGVVRALPLLGLEPFLIHNSDSVWIEHNAPNLPRLAAAWDGARMDTLMLVAERATSLGYEGHGDFEMDADGRLRRRSPGRESAYVFTGVSIAHPRLFHGLAEAPFSLNKPWDQAIAAGRMYGVALDGIWMHVGTPEALADAGRLIERDRSGRNQNER